MKSVLFTVLVLMAVNGKALATDAAPDVDPGKAPDSEVEIDLSPTKDDSSTKAPSTGVADFCFFAGKPPADVKYVTIKKLKVGKGTYGGVKEILPKFATYAQANGADAIIEYTGSQRFGFWPWRMVRPVVQGVAVKWSSPPGKDCAAMGGSTLSTILATDRPPAQ